MVKSYEVSAPTPLCAAVIIIGATCSEEPAKGVV